MAGDDDDMQDRTEEATPQRRQEWRKEGRVVQSRELASALLLLAVTGALYGSSTFVYSGLRGYFEDAFREMSVLAQGDYTIEAVMGIMQASMKTILYVLAPIGMASLVAGVGTSLMQVGVLWTTKPMEPSLDKISPLAGLKRIFSIEGLMETFKAIFKFILVAVALYLLIKSRLPETARVWDFDVPGIMRFLGSEIIRIMASVAGAMLVVAGADYAFQRFRHEQKMRMTKEEVKEERKQSDGNPQVKARLRGLQRKAATSKMLEAVKSADVVITNPTHFAVALVYDREAMMAPRVVAKGVDHMAQRIKEIARENGVPCVENVPLARALYKALKIGQMISRDLYNAVAEVLAYVYRLKGKVNS